MSSPYADFPEIDVTDPSDSLGYGSDTLSELFKILNGKIIGNRRPHVINPWVWEGPFTLQKQLVAPSPETGQYALATGQVNIYPDATTGRLVVQKFGGTVVELENIISVLQDLTNVTITSVANGDGIRYDSALGKWTNQPFPTGTGEANTISNVGSAGIGVWKQKVGVNHELKKLFPTSTKITITDDTANSRITFEILESAINRNNEGGGALTVTNGGTGAATLTGMLRGNGTSAVTAVGLGSSGDVLTNVSGTPTFQAPAGGGGGGSNPAIGPKTGQVQAGGGPVAAGSTLGSGLCNGWKTAALTSGNVTTDIDADGQYIALNTTATSQTNSEINSVLATIFRTDLNPKIWLKIKFTASIVNTRSFIGFTDLIALPQNSSAFIQNQNGFGWNYDTSALTNIQLTSNNTNATPNLVDTGVVPVLNTAMNIKIELISSSSTAKITLDGTPFTTTTKVPASSAKLGFVCREQNTSGSIRTMNVYYMYCEQDK